VKHRSLANHAIAAALVVSGLAALPAAGALAQSEPPAQPAAPTYAPRGEPMTFAVVTGDGPRGATRWISASGQIQADTARKFDAFRKANAVDGLEVVLDSQGGRVQAAMALGRMIRAARMTTSVGRTIEANGRAAVRTTEVRCASACVLVLMGGVTRHAAEDARVEVHMFSVELDSEGNRARNEVTFRDVEQAQRTMASHAIFVAEMGVQARFLELMTQASFRGAAKRLTRDEMTTTALAFVTAPERTAAASVWTLSSPTAPPQLIRSAALVDSPQARIDHELVLECDTVRGFYWVTYRQSIARGEAGKTSAQLRTARLATGPDGWDYVFRAPNNRPLTASRLGSDLWMKRNVPRKVFEDAVAARRLAVEVEAPGRDRQQQDLFDASLARALPELARRCDARPGQVTVGPNPRR
jgi:hypothetical protein